MWHSEYRSGDFKNRSRESLTTDRGLVESGSGRIVWSNGCKPDLEDWTLPRDIPQGIPMDEEVLPSEKLH